MQSNFRSFSTRLNNLPPPPKRKLTPESNSTTATNGELEERINDMYAKFNSEIQKLQQQFEQVLSRIDGFEHRLRHIETLNEITPQHIKPNVANIEQFTKDFEERFDLVETNSQTLTERLDSCQQSFAKMNMKTENFENQLINLQQRLNNFNMDEQPATENVFTYSPPTLDQLQSDNDECDSIEKALCTPCEQQIFLSTAQVQYGLFDVCDKYNVILAKEDDKLKLFNHQKQIDERPWGEVGRNNYATCIHWCSFLDIFLILYRFKLYTLSLKRNSKTSELEFDDLKMVSSIRVYSLKHDTTQRAGNAVELLRFLTTSPGLSGYLYLNRGYRRIELVNTNSWRFQRGWSKFDLDYGERDEIRSIKLSYEGTYLAMNIRWNDRLKFIDLRKHDDQLTLLKRIRMPKDSASLSHRVQIPFGEKKWWLIVDEKNQCYKVSTDPNDDRIIPIRTDQIQAIENVQIRLCFACNYSYLLVGKVIGDYKHKQGVFSFYKLIN